MIINVNAQDVLDHKFGELGFRFMPTFSSLKISTSTGGTTTGEVTLGYGVGGFLAFNFTDHVGVQGEVIYNSISQKFVESNVEHKIKLQYVNIPLLLSLNTGKSKPVNLNISAGPQIGISVGSSIATSQSISGDTLTIVADPVFAVKRGDLGFAYGAGIDFGLNPAQTFRVGIGYRGVLGLLDISDQSRSVTTNSYYILDRTRIRTNAVYMGVSIMF